MLTILGIDPGFDRLGCAILKKQKGKNILKYSACVSSDPKNNYEKRLLFLGKELKKIILRYKPDAAVVEKLFFSKNQKTAIRVAEARGMIIFLLASQNIPLTEMAPSEIKTAVTGYGKADKNQVRKMVQLILKLPVLPKYDDETDAIAAALACPATKIWMQN